MMMSELLLPHLHHKLLTFPRMVVGTTITSLDGNQDVVHPADQEPVSGFSSSVSHNLISRDNFCHPGEVHMESGIIRLSW